MRAQVLHNYTCEGSSSTISSARSKLVNTFGYSSSAQVISYNTNTLDTYIVPQLSANKPIFMGGVDSSKGTGHAWVCDGYRRYVQTLIHNPGTQYEYNTYVISGFYLSMNWGWNTISNGWFLYSNFNPGNDNYTTSLSCIIGIHP